MTYEHIEELRRELVESVAIQLSHYYEDEEDFEERQNLKELRENWRVSRKRKDNDE